MNLKILTWEQSLKSLLKNCAHNFYVLQRSINLQTLGLEMWMLPQTSKYYCIIHNI
jgi:hypothetical protein